MPSKTYVAAPEVAKFLNVADVTLRKWRARDYGPPSYTFGTAVRYDMAEVRRWAKQQVTTPVPANDDPIVVDPDETVHVLDLIDQVHRDEDETPQDVIRRAQNCSHGQWDRVPVGRPGDMAQDLVCAGCKVTPELAVALGLSAEIYECGHELVDAEDWKLLENHVESEEMGEGTFRSCEMDMPDWNTDAQDVPAEAA